MILLGRTRSLLNINQSLHYARGTANGNAKLSSVAAISLFTTLKGNDINSRSSASATIY